VSLSLQWTVTCDWILFDGQRIPPNLKLGKQICGFRGDVSRCQRDDEDAFLYNYSWMSGNLNSIVNQSVEYARRSDLELNADQLKYTLWKGT
jgi:hypothetical protein